MSRPEKTPSWGSDDEEEMDFGQVPDLDTGIVPVAVAAVAAVAAAAGQCNNHEFCAGMQFVMPHGISRYCAQCARTFRQLTDAGVKGVKAGPEVVRILQGETTPEEVIAADKEFKLRKAASDSNDGAASAQPAPRPLVQLGRREAVVISQDEQGPRPDPRHGHRHGPRPVAAASPASPRPGHHHGPRDDLREAFMASGLANVAFMQAMERMTANQGPKHQGPKHQGPKHQGPKPGK